MKYNHSLTIAAALIAIVVGILYVPALQNGFVNWDDDQFIYKNHSMGSLDASFVKYAFTAVVASNYHPLTLLSYGIDTTIWGNGPFGFHLTNVILHMINTFLVVILTGWLIRLAGGGWSEGPIILAASFAGILFGVHPLHVESVAWISERKDLLYAFFYLMSMMAYIAYVRRLAPRSMYMLSIVLGAFSMLSKPMAVTLPAVLLILDYYPLRRLWGGTSPGTHARGGWFILLEKTPYAALSSALSYATVRLQGDIMLGVGKLYLHERLFNALKALGLYLRKFLLPVDLAPLYGLSVPVRLTPMELLWGIVVIIISVYCLIVFRKKRLLPAVWAWFLVSIAPTAGLIQVGRQYAADRYAYLPILGFMILAGLGAGWVYDKAMRKSHGKRMIMGIGFSLVVLILTAMSVQTYRQIGYWKSPETLWKRELAVYPEEAFAYYQLGHAAIDRGDISSALNYFNQSIRLWPMDVETVLSRGVAYFLFGDYVKALSDLELALMLNPDHPDARSYRDLAKRALKNVQK